MPVDPTASPAPSDDGLVSHGAASVRHNPSCVSCARAEHQRDEARAEVERLRAVIERERSNVADGIAAMMAAIASRAWLGEPGRGSYAWDDERYQREFGAALEEIEAALEPLRRIATDWGDCPTKPEEIAAARIDWRARAEAAAARVKALEEALTPFAALVPHLTHHEDEERLLTHQVARGKWVHVTVADFRRARAALKGGENV